MTQKRKEATPRFTACHRHTGSKVRVSPGGPLCITHEIARVIWLLWLCPREVTTLHESVMATKDEDELPT
jgi:hypothetical protein